MKSKMYVCAVFLVLVSAEFYQPLHAEPFMKINAVRESWTDAGMTATYRIEALASLSGTRVAEISDTLVISCEEGSIDYWRALITVGDTMVFPWQVVSRPTAGWLIKGGRAGSARLTAPDNGLSVNCMCEGKTDPQIGRLDIMFIGEDDMPEKLISCHGAPFSFWGKRIPFRTARSAEPPVRIVFVADWAPAR